MGINMSKLKINQLAVISLLTLGVTACGGGGGPKVYSGVFKDSNVQGMQYSSGGQNGVTGKNGEFKFEEDSNVKFSVGGVTLGSAKAKNVMTPIDLVKDGKADTLEVVNRVRFLMMLDNDADPENGIEIDSKVLAIAKKEWGTVDFGKGFPSDKEYRMSNQAVKADQGDHFFPNPADAKAHFNRTLAGIKATKRCFDSGAFVGTLSGTEKGNIALMLDPTTDGKVIGSLFIKDAAVEITSEKAINYDSTSREFTSKGLEGKRFTGTLKSGNVLEGTWVDVADAKKKGEFKAERMGGDSGATYRYTAVYQGKNTPTRGIIALDVYSNNSIKGESFDVSTNKTLSLSGKLINDDLSNVKLENGDELKGYIDVDKITASIKGKSLQFDASRCKLSK